MIVSAASPLPNDVTNGVKSRLDCNIKEGWGMSELPVGLSEPDDDARIGSIGQLLPNTEGKIVHPVSREILGPFEEGELMVKGPQIMMGYLDDPDKTKECLDADGWLKTGDLAKYDQDGFFYITDRMKELIKVRGYQVPPAELEDLLRTHPKIKEAAVIPVEDELSGQVPRAYIQLVREDIFSKKDEILPFTEVEVQDWVKDRVAPYKRLAGGVEFVDDIPKSTSGKVLRRVLAALYKEEKMNL